MQSFFFSHRDEMASFLRPVDSRINGVLLQLKLLTVFLGIVLLKITLFSDSDSTDVANLLLLYANSEQNPCAKFVARYDQKRNTKRISRLLTNNLENVSVVYTAI